jgi:1-acyl-sn-glycerol-3-phosphate acyltransferase/nucleoside-diphosphate-sugar epimerase
MGPSIARRPKGTAGGVGETEMRRVIVIDERDSVAELLVGRLRESPSVEVCLRASRSADGMIGERRGLYARLLGRQRLDTVVYAPPLCPGKQMMPDLTDALAVFQACADAHIRKLILLSSAAVYGACPQNPGLISESRTPPRNGQNPIGGEWAELEKTALRCLCDGADVKVTILRPAAVPVRDGADYFSRLFGNRLALVLPGYDPPVQVLSLNDLARAVRCAVESSAAGIYNVAPDGVIPLGAALRLAGSRRLPIARSVQRAARAALSPLGLSYRTAQLEYIRYPWTVSNRKIKRELGVTFNDSSAGALIDFAGRPPDDPRVREVTGREFDDFGMDKEYVAACGRTLFGFLRRYYWRMEVDGLERVPREGRAILVGIHRGVMPWDGAMVLDLLAQRYGRFPRFLMHPGLVKFPFIFNLMTKLGGIVACRENADHILEHDEVLGIFPEGVRGPFRLYRDAYRVGKFHNDFVKIALRLRAPIIPFVIVGSAEIFPVLGKIEWGWWKRYSQWPFIPLTPTFPFLPLPLPSKWHMQFLAPVQVAGQYPPEAADDPAVVRAISRDVRSRMKETLENIVSRRKSIFYGSVFEEETHGPVLKQEAG